MFPLLGISGCLAFKELHLKECLGIRHSGMFQNVCVFLLSQYSFLFLAGGGHTSFPDTWHPGGKANPQLKFLTLLMGDHGVTMIERFQI